MNFDTQFLNARDSFSMPSDDIVIRTFLIATKSFESESLATNTSPKPLHLTPRISTIPFTQSTFEYIAVTRHYWIPLFKQIVDTTH